MILCKVSRLLKRTNNITFVTNYHKFKPPWKILFFGTDSFSLESLKLLHLEYNNVSLIKRLEVVTSLSKDKPNAVAVYSQQNQLKLHEWPYAHSSENDFDIGIVVSFGKLIPLNIIQSFPLGMLNVHASLLPRWRGAAPIIYALAKGDKRTGISIMQIKPDKFDIGDILLQVPVDIDYHTKMPELHKTLSIVGANALLETVNKLPSVLDEGVTQSESDVTLAPRVKASFAHIDWEKMTSESIYNLERSVYSLFPLTSTWNGLNVKLYDITVDNVDFFKEQIEIRLSGFVRFDKTRNVLRIKCCNNSSISVKRITVVGKRTMTAREFDNGYVKKLPLDKRLFK